MSNASQPRLRGGRYTVPIAGIAAFAALLVPQPSHAARPQGELGKLQRTPVLTAAEDVGAGGCPAVVAHYSRGAGENEDFDSVDWPGRTKYYGGVGEEMSVLANYLADHVYPPTADGRARIKTVANVAAPPTDYDADGFFPATLEISTAAARATLDSIRKGAAALLDDLAAIRTACPDTRIALIGYSQGAAVVRVALAATAARPVDGRYIADLPAPGHVLAVAFGDAFWNTRPDYRIGTRYLGDTYLPTGVGSAGEQGVASLLWQSLGAVLFKPADRPYAYPYPTPDRYDLISVCHGRDPSCQFARQTANVLGFVGHLDYDTREPVAAGALIAQQFADRVSAAVPVPTVTIPEGQTCLPRGAQRTLAVRADAAPPGAPPAAATAAWSLNGALFNGRPAKGATVQTIAAPGAPGALTVRGSSSPLSNDLLSVSTPSAVSPTGTATIFQSRLCPLW